MIDVKNLNSELTLITTDERTKELDLLLEIAENDKSHPLHANYTKNKIKLEDFIFVNIVLTNNKPTLFYGLQKKPWMADTARAYTRMYRPHNARGSLSHGSIILIDGGYHTLNEWWKPHAEGLIVTRNVKEDKREILMQVATNSLNWLSTNSALINNTTLLGKSAACWKKYWKPYPFVCHINGADQYVMYMGECNLNFLKNLHVRPYEC